MKKVLVLGCTGSIGSSTLSVMREFPDQFKVCGLVAHTSREKTEALAAEFGCPYLLTGEYGHLADDCGRIAQAADEELYRADKTQVLGDFIEKTAPDIAVNGIAGSSGLLPSIAVLKAGVHLALANKETVVMAWSIVSELAKKVGAAIIPVDSEHSALFNLLQRVGRANVQQLVITASGGPFRDLPREALAGVTLEASLKHPTWSMGKKITVDSATLANKGLEVIEACRLFGFAPDYVQVVVHPQSVVHSLVRTADGMLYAQLSEPDMRHPILGALSWPDMAMVGVKSSLSRDIFSGNLNLNFVPPRMNDFPMLPLAYEAARLGGSYTIAYNAANEAAANAFIEKRIGFTDIANITQSVLQADWTHNTCNIAEVMSMNKTAYSMAQDIIASAVSAR